MNRSTSRIDLVSARVATGRTTAVAPQLGAGVRPAPVAAPRVHRAPAPVIAGLEVVRPLGAGGFADVHLYRQLFPRRRVAVKVLRAPITECTRRAFVAEADLMASLSTHPSIVTVHDADIAADGRPYLVMEYCPHPDLSRRLRRGAFDVADALEIGIQIAGAVETSHRAGIVHGDIKPANVLQTEYGRSALTDFGLAATVEGRSTSRVGLSVPWSAPEAFGLSTRPEVARDVWALGATVCSLLLGHSPFEPPERTIDSAALIHRIRTSPLPSLDRAGASESLQRVLATSMAKGARERFSTVLGFAQALQAVQEELSLPVTVADVLGDARVQAGTGEGPGVGCTP